MDPVEALKHVRTLIRAAAQIDDVAIHRNLKEAEAIIAKAMPRSSRENRAEIHGTTANQPEVEGSPPGARRPEAEVNRFEQWLRRTLAPRGLSDIAIACIAGALAWTIAIFLKNMVAVLN